MYGTVRLRLTDLNDHLVCRICAGYLIDATTIIECLHSYEMQRRRFFYAPQTANADGSGGISRGAADSLYSLEERGEIYIDPWLAESERGVHHDVIKSDVSVCLRNGEHLLRHHRAVRTTNPDQVDEPEIIKTDTRYLLCPACLTIGLLNKFIRCKFQLNTNLQTCIYHTNEILDDYYTLADVISLYGWRRKEPLNLYYLVYDEDLILSRTDDQPTSISFILQNTSLAITSLQSSDQNLRPTSCVRKNLSHGDYESNSSTESYIPDNDDGNNDDTDIDYTDYTAYERSPLRALGLVPIANGDRTCSPNKHNRSRTTPKSSDSGVHRPKCRRKLSGSFVSRYFNIKCSSSAAKVKTMRSRVDSLSPLLSSDECTKIDRSSTSVLNMSLNTNLPLPNTEISENSVCMPSDTQYLEGTKFAHFKKRMINAATTNCDQGVKTPIKSGVAIVTLGASVSGADASTAKPIKATDHTIAHIIGLTEPLRPVSTTPSHFTPSCSSKQPTFKIYEDPPTAATPAISHDLMPTTPSSLSHRTASKGKIGIVISHGRAMTLQDKLRMTTSGAAFSGPAMTPPSCYPRTPVAPSFSCTPLASSPSSSCRKLTGRILPTDMGQLGSSCKVSVKKQPTSSTLDNGSLNTDEKRDSYNLGVHSDSQEKHVNYSQKSIEGCSTGDKTKVRMNIDDPRNFPQSARELQGASSTADKRILSDSESENNVQMTKSSVKRPRPYSGLKVIDNRNVVGQNIPESQSSKSLASSIYWPVDKPRLAKVLHVNNNTE